MTYFIRFEDVVPDSEVVEEPAAESGASSGTDAGSDSDPNYNQLIYEYLINQDTLSGTRQEELYAAQKVLLESHESQLQEIYTAIEWNMSLLLIMFVLFLFRSVRRWVYKLTGGMNDVS